MSEEQKIEFKITLAYKPNDDDPYVDIDMGKPEVSGFSKTVAPDLMITYLGFMYFISTGKYQEAILNDTDFHKYLDDTINLANKRVAGEQETKED